MIEPGLRLTRKLKARQSSLLQLRFRWPSQFAPSDRWEECIKRVATLLSSHFGVDSEQIALLTKPPSQYSRATLAVSSTNLTSELHQPNIFDLVNSTEDDVDDVANMLQHAFNDIESSDGEEESDNRIRSTSNETRDLGASSGGYRITVREAVRRLHLMHLSGHTWVLITKLLSRDLCLQFMTFQILNRRQPKLIATEPLSYITHLSTDFGPWKLIQ